MKKSTTPVPLSGYPLLAWFAGGALSGQIEVRLNTSAIVPNAPLSGQLFVDPSFPGYVAATGQIWATRTLAGVNFGQALSGLLAWVATSDNTSLMVQGYYVRFVTPAGSIVIAAENFRRPISMAAAGSRLAFVVLLFDLVIQVT